jgi:TPR repeat protein
MIKEFSGFMIGVIVFFIIQTVLYGKEKVLSSGTLFNINKEELALLIDKGDEGDLKSIKKLEEFYTFSKDDTDKGLKWLIVGIKLYDKTSLDNYFDYLGRGNKTKKIQKVIQWLENQGEDNNAFAQRELYKLYRNNDFIDKDLVKSEYWLKKLKLNLSNSSF